MAPPQYRIIVTLCRLQSLYVDSLCMYVCMYVRMYGYTAMRALSTRMSHSHIRCCYLIPYKDVPNRRSWNLDLVCTREPHNMPHGPSSNLSLSHERCLVICLPFVRQDKSGQATRKDKNLQPRMRLMVLLMSTAIRKPLAANTGGLVTHGIICVQYPAYLAFMRHVSCTRTSQWSIILSPPC